MNIGSTGFQASTTRQPLMFGALDPDVQRRFQDALKKRPIQQPTSEHLTCFAKWMKKADQFVKPFENQEPSQTQLAQIEQEIMKLIEGLPRNVAGLLLQGFSNPALPKDCVTKNIQTALLERFTRNDH